jgi:hypothetical protein
LIDAPVIAAISSWLQLGERPEMAGENRTDDGAGVASIIATDSASLSQFL